MSNDPQPFDGGTVRSHSTGHRRIRRVLALGLFDERHRSRARARRAHTAVLREARRAAVRKTLGGRGMSDDLHEPDSRNLTVAISREDMDELKREGRVTVPSYRDTPDVTIRVVGES